MNIVDFYKAKRIIKNSKKHGKATKGGFYACINGASVTIRQETKYYHEESFNKNFSRDIYTVSINGNSEKILIGRGIFGGMRKLYKMAAAKSTEPEIAPEATKQINDLKQMTQNFNSLALYIRTAYNKTV